MGAPEPVLPDGDQALPARQRRGEAHGAAMGERIIILAGYPFGRAGKTNTLKISRIGANGE